MEQNQWPGFEPGCSMHQLRCAYKKQLRKLPKEDPQREVLRKSYKELQAQIRARQTVRERFQRYGVAAAFGAVGLFLLGYLLHVLLFAVTPNLFPSSQYPELALRFSKALTGYTGHLLFCAAAAVFYVIYCLRRRKKTRLRHMSAGFLIGCGILAVGLFFPANLLSNSAALLCDYSAVQNNRFLTASHVQASSTVSRMIAPFGESLRLDSNLTVYFPKEAYSGEGDIVTVRYLKYTHAAAEISVELQNVPLASFSHGEAQRTLEDGTQLSMGQNSDTLTAKTADGRIFSTLLPGLEDNGTIDRRYAVGMSDLPEQTLLAAYTVLDDTDPYVKAAAIDRTTAEVQSDWTLPGEVICAMANHDPYCVILTYATENTLLKQYSYFLTIYDAQKDAVVYQTDTPLQSSTLLTLGGFQEDSLFLMQPSSRKVSLSFPLPESLLKTLRSPIVSYPQ